MVVFTKFNLQDRLINLVAININQTLAFGSDYHCLQECFEYSTNNKQQSIFSGRLGQREQWPEGIVVKFFTTEYPNKDANVFATITL